MSEIWIRNQKLGKMEFAPLGAYLNLREAGINLVKFEFSGGGDSGAIDDHRAYRYSDIRYDGDDFMEIQDEGTEIKGEDYEPFKAILDMIENIVYPTMTKDVDWWNNEGGSGHLYLDVNRNRYRMVIDEVIHDGYEYDEDEDEWIENDELRESEEHLYHGAIETSYR